jgi:hypothetical protein
MLRQSIRALGATLTIVTALFGGNASAASGADYYKGR